MFKICSKCRISKPLDEFHNKKSSGDGKTSQCKECRRKYSIGYHYNHREKIAIDKKEYYEKTGRQKAGHQSMYENKLCAQYLGIVIAERLVRHLFKNVEVMSMHNTGFDIICNRGKKIDVKTSCEALSDGKYRFWRFNIRKNTIADYFICVAFDNLTDLNPLHLWMIPGHEINHLVGLKISLSTIHKWDKWKRDIKDAQLCCTEMKEQNKNYKVS